jgi:hypothetical protein
VPGASSVDEPVVTLVGVYAGFIQPVSGSETTQGEGLRELRTHRLYTEVSVPIQYGDEVQQDGATYRVTFATQTTGISSVGDHKEVSLQYV